MLYGHHMNNGSMFSDLCKYESEDFYQDHKTIHFDTLDSFGEYEVIAAFKTVAYSEQGFKYYHFVRADGGCRQAAGGIRAAPPGEGGEAHGQGYKNKSFCEKRH